MIYLTLGLAKTRIVLAQNWCFDDSRYVPELGFETRLKNQWGAALTFCRTPEQISPLGGRALYPPNSFYNYKKHERLDGLGYPVPYFPTKNALDKPEACVVVGHVVVCILNEIDKFWGCSKTVCGVSPRLMNCAFWLGWCVLVVMCSIPMLAVAYFCFDFALKAVVGCDGCDSVVSDSFRYYSFDVEFCFQFFLQFFYSFKLPPSKRKPVPASIQ